MNSQKRSLKLLLVLALFLSANVISGCTTTTKNFQSGVIPNHVPVDDETAYSNRSALVSMMDKESLELEQSGPDYQRVKPIINRLSVAANVEQELDVYTVDAGDKVNAFAMGGNTIVVYKELLNRLPEDDELVVVLSHEVAHILGGHNSDDTQQKRGGLLGVAAAVVGIAATVATGETLAGDLAESSVAVVGSGVVRSYGRAMEHEADHIGMLLMAQAGYDPIKAIDVWNKADKLLGQSSGPSFFSTHPSHGNRKARLETDYALAQPIYEKAKQKN